MYDLESTAPKPPPPRRWLLILAAIAAGYALITPVVRYYRDQPARLPSTVPSSPITGTWRGMVTQQEPDATYPVLVNLTSREGGDVRYPTLHCGGTVRYENAVSNILRYREHITFGHCVDGALVELYLGDRENEIGFREVAAGPPVHGQLRKGPPPTPKEMYTGPALPLEGIIPY